MLFHYQITVTIGWPDLHLGLAFSPILFFIKPYFNSNYIQVLYEGNNNNNWSKIDGHLH